MCWSGNHCDYCIYYALPTILDCITHSNSIKQLSDLWGVLKLLLLPSHFYEIALNPLCVYIILIVWIHSYLVFIYLSKADSHYISLTFFSTITYLNKKIHIWSMEFRTFNQLCNWGLKPIANAWNSLLSWNSFHQSPVNHWSKIIPYSLTLKLHSCTCIITKKANSATSFHCWISNKVWQAPNWFITHRPLHQAGWTGIRQRLLGGIHVATWKPGSFSETKQSQQVT